MQQIKRFFWIALLGAALQSARGFALLGPETLANGADSWQTVNIGYHLIYGYTDLSGDPVFLGDVGGPRNIAEEYRRNVPVLYYTYDQTWLNFFGAHGATAADGAFAIMNAVPAADKMDLNQYPLESLQPNFTAQADFLTDVKSMTLHLLVEQLGLADPERFVWTLHNRDQLPNTTCPIGMTYLVVQRNFEYFPTSPSQIQYSSYINDNLYSYFIEEICTGPNPLAITVPFLTDPEAVPYTAVAANNYAGFPGFLYLNNSGNQPLSLSGGLQVGYFYTGLTRDDAAGLKYLFRTNNVNLEFPEASSLLFSVVTNFNVQQLLPNSSGTNTGLGFNGLGFYSFDSTYGYGDYGALVAASVTNSPAVLQALYPGLVIASSSNYFGPVTNYTFVQYFTNASGPGTPYPPPLVLVTASNKVVGLQERFLTTFANVIRNKSSSTTVTKIQVSTVTSTPGAPYPSQLVTNTTVRNLVLNSPSGDFFIVPLFHSNTCPINFLYTGLTNVLFTTNFLSSANTNVVTTTNTTTLTSTVIQITAFTNYTFVIHPVNCGEATNAYDNYQGIGGTKFQRADFDSLIGQFFNPVTNYYTMVALTNSQWQTRRFVRVVTQPDILLQAADLGDQGDGSVPFSGTVVRSDPNFVTSPRLNGLAGPGTIDSPTALTYNKIGDGVLNGYLIQIIGYADLSQFLGQYGSIPSLAWASFDASTNAPELYPNGTSIEDLEKQLTVQVTPTTLPAGSVGAPYLVQFSASGGAIAPPFTWSAFGVPVGNGVLDGLPPGLVMSSTGRLSGTPNSPGTYDFTLQLTDSLGRNVQWQYSITIH